MTAWKALWAARLHGKGRTISAVLSQKKKKPQTLLLCLRRKESLVDNGTGWDVMRPGLPAWPFGCSLNLPILQLIGPSLEIAVLLSLALSSHLSHLFYSLGDKLSLWWCPFIISFYNPPSLDRPCFKKQIRLLVLSTGDKVLPLKVGHLDNLGSDLLAVQWFCGHSRVGVQKEEKSGKKVKLWVRGGRMQLLFPLFVCLEFLVPLCWALYCLYHELAVTEIFQAFVVFRSLQLPFLVESKQTLMLL